MKRRIGIQASLAFLGSVIAILLSKFFFPQWKKEITDEIFDVVGIIIVLFGFLFRISARGHKSGKSREGKFLVTDGPYSMMGNPMYFGTLLIGLGVISILLNLWALLFFLIGFLLIYVPQIRKEQKILYKQFGDEYINYCKKTPKYFPNIFVLFKLGLTDCLPLRWPSVKKELPSIIGVAVALAVLETLEDVRLFGLRGYIKEPLVLFTVVTFCFITLSLFYKRKKKETNAKK